MSPSLHFPLGDSGVIFFAESFEFYYRRTEAKLEAGVNFCIAPVYFCDFLCFFVATKLPE